MSDPIETSISSSSSAGDPNSNPNPISLLHPRREPFEHGLLPIPKLVFTDPTQTLIPIKQTLLSSSTNTRRVDSAALSQSLQISPDHACLVLDTLASVLHSDSDPLVSSKPDEINSSSADVHDLLLFLYIQSYKKLLPRTHKDSAAVADVWPSTSAFDGYLSALSPLQLVRSNSRRFVPSQADEEAHQLSYLQKHLANILSLLAEPVEGEGEESLVLTMDRFEHLGFLIQFGDKGPEETQLSQHAPFFANSDPDMPAVPVPAAQVHEWLLQNIASALEHISERASLKENGPASASDQDVSMADACTTSIKASPSARGPSFIEGISKSSLVKQASDLKGSSVKVLNCHDSVIYILAPLRYATVYGCSDTTIVIGAVGKAVRIEHCERVHVITAAKRICIANCRECVFFLGVNQHETSVIIRTGILRMANNEETGSPRWSASFFMQTTEDVARAVAAAAAAATGNRSQRPSAVNSSKEDNGGSPIQKMQRQVTKVLKGFSQPPEVKSASYNPEILTSQKRQWASFQSQYLGHKSLMEPTRLFESMVVVGLHPNCDIQALYRQYIARKHKGSGRLRSALSCQNQSRVEPNLEPQVLFAYPPEKELPLKYKDLLSFCFPGGMEVHAIERTPSMSELNEILVGQEHLKQTDLSFVFRLQVADDSTMYGCCVLVEELVQKPSGLLSMISDKQLSGPSLSRHILTTRRCYCILSRFPFFQLHFGVLNSILTEERLERLTQGILLNLESPEDCWKTEERLEENVGTDSDGVSLNHRAEENTMDRTPEISKLSIGECKSEEVTANGSHEEHQMLDGDFCLLKKGINDNVFNSLDPDSETVTAKRESSDANCEDCAMNANDCLVNKEVVERRPPHAVLPLLRYCQYESSESSSSFQGSPSEERNFRSDVDDTETEEVSFSGQEAPSDVIDILEWAKVNNNGSLQIICEYYRLQCPGKGSTLRFHPLEHLHPLEFYRPDEIVLHFPGSTIDLRSRSMSLGFAEAHSALLAEEATALSVWAVACICGSLRLENVLTLFAGALLERQIVVVCSNLGILSASVLSIIPLIRPYQWQSLLMPVLPNDMLDFLDAPVPYIVGVKNKTNEVQSKLTNAILVDVNKNQVKSSSIPQLPQQKELLSSLSPYHAKLVGESYLGKKRPVYECTDVQVEAAKGFLVVLRSYLDRLCSKLRSHTITNVQSNDDKVSLLLKESFIDSFSSRDRPFMKHFVDTQLFSVHTDLVLSLFQKE